MLTVELYSVYGCGYPANKPGEDNEENVFNCILNDTRALLHPKSQIQGLCSRTYRDAHIQLEKHNTCAVLGSKVHSSLSFDVIN